MLQLSVAVGAVQDAILQVSVVESAWFVGQFESTGFTASFKQVSIFVTVTLKLQVEKLPFASVAV